MTATCRKCKCESCRDRRDALIGALEEVDAALQEAKAESERLVSNLKDEVEEGFAVIEGRLDQVLEELKDGLL